MPCSAAASGCSSPPGGHRAGTDAVLLAAAANARPGDTVVDVGAATGAVGLMVGAREPKARLIFVERDPDLAELCRRNVERTGVDGEVVTADMLDRTSRRAAGLVTGGGRYRPDQPALPGEGAGAHLAGQGPGGSPMPCRRAAWRPGSWRESGFSSPRAGWW